MKKQLLPFSLLLFFSVLMPAFSQQVELRIRYHDKKIYYTDSPVKIKLELTNNSSETFRFKSSEIRSFNFDFDVRTLTNSPLNHSDKFITDRNTDQQVFFREISLEPGESYSVIEELGDYVALSDSGVFIVRAMFYPDLHTRQTSGNIRSNSLTLNLRPAEAATEIMEGIDYETGELLKAHPIPPDEVIDYALTARQKSYWNKFLLYLDLEGLYLRSQANAEKYMRMSEEDRITTIKRYRELLQQEVVDTDIVMIPWSYEILRTTYTEFEAEVKVRERFRYTDFTEVKEYVYYLRRDDNIWRIYDYDVRNMGTE